MNSLLVINASGRVTRSITRYLTARFAAGWSSRLWGAEVLTRDIGVDPPPAVDEKWIRAAFAAPMERTAEMQQSLALSELFIDELFKAEVIVLGAPMYNFGMPGQLKAYVDQIVRVGRTFAFNPVATEPYLPLLEPKPVVVIISAGDGSVHPGGALAHLNFLEPHLQTVFGFIGLTDLTFVRVGYDEFKDDRFKRSIADAESAIEKILDQLTWKAPRCIGQHSLTPSPALDMTALRDLSLTTTLAAPRTVPCPAAMKRLIPARSKKPGRYFLHKSPAQREIFRLVSESPTAVRRSIKSPLKQSQPPTN